MGLLGLWLGLLVGMVSMVLGLGAYLASIDWGEQARIAQEVASEGSGAGQAVGAVLAPRSDGRGECGGDTAAAEEDAELETPRAGPAPLRGARG